MVPTADTRPGKIMTMRHAIAQYVHDGDTVSLEGFTHLIPTAAGHEIIRQGRRDLTVVLPKVLTPRSGDSPASKPRPCTPRSTRSWWSRRSSRTKSCDPIRTAPSFPRTRSTRSWNARAARILPSLRATTTATTPSTGHGRGSAPTRCAEPELAHGPIFARATISGAQARGERLPQPGLELFGRVAPGRRQQQVYVRAGDRPQRVAHRVG